MDEQDNLVLRYYGGEADEGLMGYYDTAASIFAFGDLMGLLSKNLYGERAYIRTTIKGVKCSAPLCYRKIYRIKYHKIWHFYDDFATLSS